MKKILLFLITLFSFCISSIHASHYMGVDMTYECLSPCTYRIHHRAYYDCSGAATATMLPPSITTAPSLTFVGLPNGCTTFPQMIGTWNFVHNVEVTPICPDSLPATACNGGTFINGVAEGYYYADFDFCVPAANPCSQFMVRFYNCCRNNSITSGAGGQGMFVDMMMDLNLGLCNNSPVFNEPASNYICAGQPTILDHSATDPDGDLLVYSLDVILSNDTVPINYLPGYDSLNFLGPDWAVSLNPSSGLISLTPNPTGGQEVGSFRIHVDEYRNGVHIGRISRDAQVTVISVGCQSNSQVNLSGIQNIDPTYWAPPDTILACAGINIGFDIIGTDVDTSNMVTVLSDIQNYFPGASTWLMGTNPTTYHVSFTPGPQQAGNTYDLSVVAESNGCLLGTYTTKNIKIIVKNSCLEYLSYPSDRYHSVAL
ncbi:MAG: hypothetical protein KDD99_27075 [Bacteroidetes bacterium]|nr:hypothetical protein [Bacteroidota bacterium]